RGAVGAHRPPGLHHGAREQRDRRARALPAHGRGCLQPGVGAERRAGAAADRGAVQGLQRKKLRRLRGTGFKGRRAIGELLVLNDELRELITARAPARKLKDAARAAGTVPLRDAALALVEAGETTLEEINRVTFVA